jgi:hypothetical protein
MPAANDVSVQPILMPQNPGLKFGAEVTGLDLEHITG